MHHRSSAYHQRAGYPEAEKAACFGSCQDEYSYCKLRAQVTEQSPLFTKAKVESSRKLVHMSFTTLHKKLCAPTLTAKEVFCTDTRCWLKSSPALVRRPLPSLCSPRG